MENKKFIFIGLVIFAILVLGIVNSITERKTVSECKEIIQKIENESFKGVIVKKTNPGHFNHIVVNSNVGIIKIIRTYPNLEYESKIGDSIIKFKNVNIVKIKHENNFNWIEYKYKVIPRECSDTVKL